LALGHSADKAPAFEVASVKRSGPQSLRNSDGGPGSNDPGRFSFTSAVLRDLLYRAYGVDDYQQQISGPAWIDSERYDIAVRIPPGTTQKQFQQMLQNLLADRFKLVVHHETKQLPVYELVLGKNGSKLRKSVESPNATAASSGPPPPARDRDGFPTLPAGRPGFVSGFGPGPHGHWTARQQPMSALAENLSGQMATGRRVIDKTGLSGKYDFTLEYDLDLGNPSAAVGDGPVLSIFEAVQQQLGLRLVPGKAFFDVVVVDQAEKTPIEN
jgi:uncharacterized protein (TIGR03435 family)